MHIFMIIAGIIIILVLWARIEEKLIMTTTYHIPSKNLGKEFDNTAFVVLADLHNKSFGKENKVLIQKINKLKPDFIVIAGDMITKRYSCLPSNAFSLVEGLAKKYKIYYAYGNHEQYMELLSSKNEDMDKELKLNQKPNQIEEPNHIEELNHNQELYYSWVQYKEELSNLGVIFLDNKDITIMKNKDKICISGITLNKEYYEWKATTEMQQGHLNTLLQKREGAFQILVAHNPVYFKEYTNWGADLILAGHLHGGMVRLPFIGGLISPQAKFLPKYDAGKFTDNEQNMIVTRGVGSHSSMPRLFNPPELVYVKLSSK